MSDQWTDRSHKGAWGFLRGADSIQRLETCTKYMMKVSYLHAEDEAPSKAHAPGCHTVDASAHRNQCIPHLHLTFQAAQGGHMHPPMAAPRTCISRMRLLQVS